MDRRTFLAGALAAPTGAETSKDAKLFVITGLGIGQGTKLAKTQNDCTIIPIKVYANSRIDAITEMLKHATVWTESEWDVAVKMDTDPVLGKLCPIPEDLR